MPKLLVVDDETFIRMLYKKEFENDGYTVLTAATPDEAMAIITSDRPDVVILDIELGDESGLKMMNRLNQEHRDCAVILNTAYSTYKSDFQTWLADAYLMKSSDLKPLKNQVRLLVEKRYCDQKK